MAIRFLLVCPFLILGVSCAFAEDSSGIDADPVEPSLARQSVNRIELALKERTNCSFNNIRLEEVIQYLERFHQIPIVLDRHALQNEGVSPDEYVIVVKSGITLETALDLVLQPLRLAHVTQGGILHITTEQKASEIFSIRVYPVADLIPGEAGDNYITLMNVIQQCSSAKWMEMDAEGGTVVPFPKSKSLAIRQTEQEHRAIEGLLAALRKAKQVQNLSSIPAARDAAPLNPIEPVTEVRLPRLRTPRSTRSWQQPRVHAGN